MNDRLNKIAILVNKTFMLLGKKPNDLMAEAYAEEIAEYNIPIVPKDVRKYVISNHKGFDYPSVTLFLDSLGIISESEKLATACDFAWKNLEPRLPRLVRSYNYWSKDKYLLYALNRIGIERIAGAQEVVDMYTNKINNWELKAIKEDFYKYYAEALKKNLTLELVKGTGTLKNEIEAPKPNQALLGSNSTPLKALDEDVKRIGENVMEIIEGRK